MFKSKELMPTPCGPLIDFMLFGGNLVADRELLITFVLIFLSLFFFRKRKCSILSLSQLLFVDYHFAIIHSLYLFLEGSLSGTQLNCQMLVKEELEKPIRSFIRNCSHSS